MCDVPSIAVFCNETIECFPGTASKFFLKLIIIIIIIIIKRGVGVSEEEKVVTKCKLLPQHLPQVPE
jgi:hypothetical protein